ncbi:MAG TPA: hypothetical protein DCS05_05895, partial [Nitrospiraceae bacterium]|nr:hypothetical protein [Nitrospiraceae bacterium]
LAVLPTQRSAKRGAIWAWAWVDELGFDWLGSDRFEAIYCGWIWLVVVRFKDAGRERRRFGGGRPGRG